MADGKVQKILVSFPPFSQSKKKLLPKKTLNDAIMSNHLITSFHIFMSTLQGHSGSVEVGTQDTS